MTDRDGGNAAEPAVGAERATRRALVLLMGARLALSLVSLLIAVALEAAGEDFSTAEWQGFYATVAFAFLATIGYGIAQRRVEQSRRFAAVNVVTDIGIVAALVHFSGGPDSVFPFLFVLVAVYGAILLEARGAMAAAALAATAYGVVLLADARGWLGAGDFGPPVSATVALTLWVVHSGAIALVATLSTVLSGELRRTGEALHQRTSDLERLRGLHQRTVESLMSGLLTTDQRDRITSFNPEAERITGRAAGDAIGREVEEVLPGIGALGRAPDGDGEGIRSRQRIAFRDRRGRELHLGVGAYVLRDANASASASGWVVIFQDVTQVVAMERDLRRSERLAAIGQLSASIAHEIRNPLASISGSIQLLRGGAGDSGTPDDPKPLMDIVVRETDRLNQLITDFLHYASPGPRKAVPLSVAVALEEVLRMFEAVRPERIQLRVEVEEGLFVRADPAQLRQVLWNLVLNGSEAMEGRGELSIVASTVAEGDSQGSGIAGRNEAEEGKDSRWAEIAVGDQGVGIPTDVLERMFDPFFSTKERGSGLGLATVHRIVEDHGGSVRVESRVGSGTQMRIRLPRAEGSE